MFVSGFYFCGKIIYVWYVVLVVVNGDVGIWIIIVNVGLVLFELYVGFVEFVVFGGVDIYEDDLCYYLFFM